MPGCGKTTAGRRAAALLGAAFIDLDDSIEAETGKTIPEIFAESGEAGFREIETRALAKLSETANESAAAGFVCSMGGGVVTRPENRTLLKKIGRVIFIQRDLDKITTEISFDESRPLLKDAEALKDLWEAREPLYKAWADIEFMNDGDEEKAAARLAEIIVSPLPSSPVCLALIGDPVEHSLSPLMHSAVFAKAAAAARYETIRVSPEGLSDFVSQARQSGNLAGFNVTIPHKERIVSLLDETRGDAALSGAVNVVTVVFGETRKGEHEIKTCRLVGFNTDMEGQLLDIRRRGYEYRGSRIAVFGTGGAALGAICKAALENAKEVRVFGRNGEKAEAALVRAAALVREHETETEVSFCGMPAADKLAGVDIFINATPLGMAGYPEDFADTSFLDGLAAGALVYDVVYTPEETALIRAARKRGLHAENGLGMLVMQGLLADALFFGASPEEWLTEDYFETSYNKVTQELRGREI